MSTELNKNQGLLEAALEIDQRRRNTLVLAKQAVRKGNLKEADQLLTELVPDEEVPTTPESEHPGTGRRRPRLVTFPTKHQ